MNKKVKLKIDMLCADDLQFGERENHTFFDTEGAYYQASFFSDNEGKMVTVREWSIDDLLGQLRQKYSLFKDKRYVTIPAGSVVTVSVVYWDQNTGSLTIGVNSTEGMGFVYFEFGDFWTELGTDGIESYVRQALEI